MSEEVAVRTADNVVTSDNLAEWTANKLGLASEEAPVAAEQEIPAPAKPESMRGKLPRTPRLKKSFSGKYKMRLA